MTLLSPDRLPAAADGWRRLLSTASSRPPPQMCWGVCPPRHAGIKNQPTMTHQPISKPVSAPHQVSAHSLGERGEHLGENKTNRETSIWVVVHTNLELACSTFSHGNGLLAIHLHTLISRVSCEPVTLCLIHSQFSYHWAPICGEPTKHLIKVKGKRCFCLNVTSNRKNFIYFLSASCKWQSLYLNQVLLS